MEKKYHDIIVNLIKQNSKYSGCEPILDDIVEDVFEHSKIVLSSVTNEDVINAYLNKVIATSLITVPKRLNFNTRNKHRVINTIQTIVEKKMPEAKLSLQEDIREECYEQDFSTDDGLFDEIVISEDETTGNSTLEELPVAEEALPEENIQSDLQDNIEETEIIEEPAVELEKTEVFEESSMDPLESFNFIEENQDSESDLIEIDNNEQEITDSNPVEQVECLEVSEPDLDETADFNLNETFEVNNESDVLEEPAIYQMEIADTVEENQGSVPAFAEIDNDENEIVDSNRIERDDSAEIAELSLEEVDELNLTEAESLDINDESEVLEETSTEPAFDKNLVDKMINGVPALEEAEDESLVIESLDNITIEEDELTLLDEDKSYATVPEENSELQTEDISELEINDAANVSVNDSLEKYDAKDELERPCYNCFNYEPEEAEIDSEEICKILCEYDEKHPDKKVLRICKLKYENKLSVNEIAVELGITDGDVIEVLTDIIELIKD